MKPSLYAQRRKYPYLVIHAAAGDGSESLVQMIVASRADPDSPVEIRAEKEEKCWLPLVAPMGVPAEQGSNADRGLSVGETVALQVEDATAALAVACGSIPAELGGIIEKAKARSTGFSSNSPVVLQGKLAEILGEDQYRIEGLDFASIVAGTQRPRIIACRSALRTCASVQSIHITVLRPLHLVAHRNQTLSLRSLLLARADPAAQQGGGEERLALHWAVQHLNLEAVKALTAAGSPLDTRMKNASGTTPLQPAVEAAIKGNSSGFDILDVLLKARASVDLPCTADGRAPLHYASSARNLPLIDLLLQHQANPMIVDPKRRTPLHEAVNGAAPSQPSFDIERRLLMARASVNALDVSGRTPLHYAFVKFGQPFDSSPADPVETVTSLCAAEGVKVDIADEFGGTPLLYAARRSATISSLYLAKRGACLQIRDGMRMMYLALLLMGDTMSTRLLFSARTQGKSMHQCDMLRKQAKLTWKAKQMILVENRH